MYRYVLSWPVKLNSLVVMPKTQEAERYTLVILAFQYIGIFSKQYSHDGSFLGRIILYLEPILRS
jgi:hypothetical protein